MRATVAAASAPVVTELPSFPSGSGTALGAAEIPEQQIVAVAADHGIGQHRDLAAAARRVDDVVRHCIAGRVAAQLRDQLETLVDRRPEVSPSR